MKNILSILLLTSIITLASTPNKKKTNPLTQAINFGFSNTTGNADTLTFNGSYRINYHTLGYRQKKLNLSFRISAYVAKYNGVKKDEEFNEYFNVSQDLINGWAGYTSATWMRNTFYNLENKVSLGSGISKELYKDNNHRLKIKLGLSYNKEEYLYAIQNNQENAYFALNESIEYNAKINDKNTFHLKIMASENFDNFSRDLELSTVAGINMAISEKISLTVEETIRYATIPAGEKFTNTKTIIRIGYSF